jgi:type I restriction-modification system DNA methylase subunit
MANQQLGLFEEGDQEHVSALPEDIPLEGGGDLETLEPTEETPSAKVRSEKRRKQAAGSDAASDMQKGMHLSRILERVMTDEGQSAITIFRDFLEVTEITLSRLPEHFNSLAQTQTMAEDPPEIRERWQSITAHYRNPKQAFERLKEAFAFVVEATEDAEGDLTYTDVLGCAYMEFISLRDQKYKGQYFTPAHVARMMAEITCGGIEDEVKQRLRTAMEKAGEESPWVQALALMGMCWPDEEGARP